MKKVPYLFGLFFLVVLFGCSKSEEADVNNPNTPDPDSEVPSDPERVDYQLLSFNNSGVTGTASFIPNDDDTTTVYIELVGATQEEHPATINFGNVETGGAIAIELETCTCAISETVITQLDDGTPITFVELMNFDGHLNIFQSPTDATKIAVANIGANAN